MFRRRPGVSALFVIAVVGAVLPIVGTSPVEAATSTVTSTATGDTYVSAAQPNNKFGGAKQLRASGTPTQWTYVQFNVKDISGTVTQATLTLRPTRSASVPVEVHSVDSSWSEKSLTWSTAPAPDPAVLSSVSSVPADRLDLDVTSAVTGNSTVSFAIEVPAASSSSSVVAEFGSREDAKRKPTLTITTGDTTTSDTTAPGAPTGLEGAPADRSVSLEWNANTLDSDLAGYRIYRKLTSGGTWTPVAEVSAPTTTFIDTGLTNGTSYDYEITAYDTSGNESNRSLPLSITPAPQTDVMAPATPVGLTATAGDGTVALGWQPNTEPDLSAYRVYRKLSSSSTWPTQWTGTATNASYVDLTAANGTSYDYRVTAVDTTGNQSNASSAVTAQPMAGSSSSSPCSTNGTYSSSVFGTSGLAAYWRLGDTSGSSACDAVGASAGTYNAVTLGAAGAISGDGNSAVTFKGSGAAKVPDNARLDPSSSMSAEAWVSPTTTNTTQVILRKGDQYLFRLNGARVEARLWTSAGTFTVTSGAVVTAGRYQQVAMTYGGGVLRVYRNGSEVASTPATGTIAGSGNSLYLGASWGTYDYLTGDLDDVSLYTTALPAETVASHYSAATQGGGGGGGGGGTGGGTTVAGPDQLSAIGAPESAGLTWSSVANATGYRVYQRAADGSWPATPLTTTSATSYVVRELADGQGYTFKVTAVVGGTETSASPTAQATATDNVLLAAGDIADSTFRSEKTAQLLDRNPGQVLMLGDATYDNGTVSEYRDYYAPTWGRHLWRTKAAIGNHEYNTDNANPYWDYFGSAAGPRGLGYYSYDVGGWHVVVLNSNCRQVGGCYAGSTQEKWLKADLASSTAECTLAMWHHPRFTSTSPGAPDDMTLDFWQDLQADGAEIVLNGHDHAYERFAPQTPAGVADANGLRQFTVGTGGRSEVSASTRDPNSQIRISDTFGVLRLDLGAAGYSWKFLPIDGSTKTDSGTGTCH